MTPFLIYSLAAVLLAGLGIHGLISRRHLLRQIMALNVLAGGVFLLLISTAYRNQGIGESSFADPVPHAMVLTGIVVAISATAFALALVRRIYHAQEQDMNSDLTDEVQQKDSPKDSKVESQNNEPPKNRTDSAL
ncbi:sodium:proton antiporter [Desulfonatronum thioautotrophicum]|uniref:sodium:proton antiporter n=1 Tax=Desulfonatronum thioautotrophicum TaxID=617001 RepID=UPI0005EB4744|nr:cation:proton antiporter subunit C [Desulfonatronum thioautotrophicum]